MASLAEIRARLAAQDQKSQGNSNRQGGENGVYAHWNIEEGSNATVRFLPDADPSNNFFWVERQIIKLPFAGIKGGDGKMVEVQVPCMEMWNENCPILAEVRTFFKDPTLEDLGRKYWKKRSYLFQGFVRQSPMIEEKTPENPIRRFVISSQIFNVIKASLMDPEMENIPTDFDNGLDFRIAKTSKGGYADYSTSNWARKESSLTDAERDAIAQYGLFDLKDFLPKKPSEAELRVIKEMFEASLEGKAYDVDKWGAYYRPWGVEAPAGSAPVAEAAPVSKPIASVSKIPAVDTQPWDEEDEAITATPAATAAPAAPASNKANDILAQIRARQKTA